MEHVVTQTPVEPVLVPQPPYKKGTPIALVLLLMVLTAVASSAITYIVVNKSTGARDTAQTAVSLQYTPSPSPVNQNSTRLVSTRYWKAQFPQEWHYLECQSTDAFFFDPRTLTDSTEVCNFEPGGSINIIRIKDPSTFPIPVSTSTAQEPYVIVENKRPFTVDGIDGFRQSENNVGGPGTGMYDSVYIQKDGALFIFTLANPAYLSTFEGLLKSFIFAE